MHRTTALLSAVALAVLSGTAAADRMRLTDEQLRRIEVIIISPNLELAQTGVDKSHGVPVPPSGGKPGKGGGKWMTATIPMGEPCTDDLQPPVPGGMQVVRRHGFTTSGKRVHRNDLRIDQVGPAARICLVRGAIEENVGVPFKYGSIDEPAVAE